MSYEEAEDTDLKILCPYCGAPWTAKMLVDYNTTCYSEETGCVTEAWAEIYCSNCKKLVYKKQY